jgi:hypothetical protein
MAVTRTISEFDGLACTPAGHIVALNGTAGKREPSPADTVNDVPPVPGALASVEIAKLA